MAAATAASPLCCEHTPGLTLAPSLGSAYRASFKGHACPRVSGHGLGMGMAGADLRGRHSPAGRCRSQWPGRRSQGWWPAGSRRAPRAWGTAGERQGHRRALRKGNGAPGLGAKATKSQDKADCRPRGRAWPRAAKSQHKEHPGDVRGPGLVSVLGVLGLDVDTSGSGALARRNQPRVGLLASAGSNHQTHSTEPSTLPGSPGKTPQQCLLTPDRGDGSELLGFGVDPYKSCTLDSRHRPCQSQGPEFLFGKTLR